MNRTAGRAKPAGPDYLAQQIAELRAELAELRAARTLESASIGSGGLQTANFDGQIDPLTPGSQGWRLESSGDAAFGGTLTLGESGSFRIVDDAGRLIALLGRGLDNNYGIGTTRADGSQMFTTDSATFTGIFDKLGHCVVSDDYGSGNGLATPHLSLASAMYDTNVGTWPQTTSTSFTTIAAGYIERQNPKISFTAVLACGGSAQFQLFVNGSQIGSTQTVTNSSTFWSQTVPWPSSTSFGIDYFIELKARVNSGSQSAAGIMARLRGDQS